MLTADQGKAVVPWVLIPSRKIPFLFRRLLSYKEKLNKDQMRTNF